MPTDKQGRTPTVVVADDDPRILALAALILSSRYEVIAQVADGEALVETVSRLKPDAAVVDIGMPGLNGIQAVRRLKASSPVAVVYLTGQGESALIEEALAAGGLGYVLKVSASEDLIPAVEAALAGKRFLSPSLK